MASLKGRPRPDSQISETRPFLKVAVQELDTVSLALKSHYSKMNIQDLHMSTILQGELQKQNLELLGRKNMAIEAKITLAKEVTLQKVLINSRKTDFRITKASSKKKENIERRQKAVEEAFNNKNKKFLEENDQKIQRLRSFEAWQKQWLNYMNLWIFIEKIASIRRSSTTPLL